MNAIRFANRVTRKYGDQLSSLLGLDRQQVTFVKDPSTQIAETSGTQISLNPAWFKGANRRDAAGAIVHELTHAYQNAPGSAYDQHSKSYEAFADAARARLGFGHGSGYSSGLEQRYTNLNDRRFARVAGELAAGTGGFNVKQPGPTAGRSPGSRRNTGANANSKAGAGAYAALSAAQAQGIASQAAGLQDAYTQALMAIKQQRGIVKGQAIQARAAARDQAVSDMGATEGDALQRGIQGSSVAAINQEGVIQARNAALIQANSAQGDALAQLRLQKLGAQSALNTGLSNLQAQQAAQEAELQVQRYQNGLVDSASRYQELYQKALARIAALRGKPPRGQSPAAVPPNPYVPGTRLEGPSGAPSHGAYAGSYGR